MLLLLLLLRGTTATQHATTATTRICPSNKQHERKSAHLILQEDVLFACSGQLLLIQTLVRQSVHDKRLRVFIEPCKVVWDLQEDRPETCLDFAFEAETDGGAREAHARPFNTTDFFQAA